MHAYASSENKCKYMLKNAGTEVPKVQKQGNITATKQEIWMHQQQYEDRAKSIRNTPLHLLLQCMELQLVHTIIYFVAQMLPYFYTFWHFHPTSFRNLCFTLVYNGSYSASLQLLLSLVPTNFLLLLIMLLTVATKIKVLI